MAAAVFDIGFSVSVGLVRGWRFLLDTNLGTGGFTAPAPALSPRYHRTPTPITAPGTPIPGPPALSPATAGTPGSPPMPVSGGMPHG
ncbi:hypothetical protein GCM10019017_19270 [Streptomyces showdoensis]